MMRHVYGIFLWLVLVFTLKPTNVCHAINNHMSVCFKLITSSHYWYLHIRVNHKKSETIIWIICLKYYIQFNHRWVICDHFGGKKGVIRWKWFYIFIYQIRRFAMLGQIAKIHRQRWLWLTKILCCNWYIPCEQQDLPLWWLTNHSHLWPMVFGYLTRCCKPSSNVVRFIGAPEIDHTSGTCDLIKFNSIFNVCCGGYNILSNVIHNKWLILILKLLYTMSNCWLTFSIIIYNVPLAICWMIILCQSANCLLPMLDDNISTTEKFAYHHKMRSTKFKAPFEISTVHDVSCCGWQNKTIRKCLIDCMFMVHACYRTFGRSKQLLTYYVCYIVRYVVHCLE